MNYKLSIDEKKLKKLLQPEKQDIQDENFTKKALDEVKEEQPKTQTTDQAIKNELDYYMKQLDTYNGKTIDEIARDKYQPEKQALDLTTDDELYEKAKAYADSYKAEKQTKLQNSADSEVNKFNEQAKNIQEKSDETQKAIKNKYEQNVFDSKNSAIKNGIGRSSIIENIISDYQNKRDEQFSENLKSTKSDIDAINENIKKVEENLGVALKNLDMETAVRLNDELYALKSARDKANLSANKYNAQIEDKIQKYKKELLKSEEGQAILDYIERGRGELFANAKKSLVNYIDELPIDEAIKELSNEQYSRLLGSDVVAELNDYLERKKEHSK